jgi:hypothetical protein
MSLKEGWYREDAEWSGYRERVWAKRNNDIIKSDLFFFLLFTSMEEKRLIEKKIADKFIILPST